MVGQLLCDTKGAAEATMMEERIKAKVDELSERMIQEVIKVVKIDSVRGESMPDAPYGAGVKKALIHTLDLAKKLGFQTKNLDNHIGYAYLGDQEEYVCAIGHLDVVPVGSGWEYPPFSGHVQDGRIISRGVLDNKGPIYACLFALLALQELEVDLKRQVRIIFGCNEESGFNDLKHYLERERAPVAGFTPDCKYPVVYAERGRARIMVSSDHPKELLDFANEYVLNQGNDGKRLGIDYQNIEFGHLEVRNYRFVDETHFVFDVSYPAGIVIDTILERLRSVNEQLHLEVVQNYDPVFFDKDCKMVKVMQKTYETITGMDGSPVTTTGGTYAKLMPNIVPFGPSFPGQKGIGHQPNEWMEIHDLIANAKIYALTLYDLGSEVDI